MEQKQDSKKDTSFRKISSEELKALQKAFDLNFAYPDKENRAWYSHSYKNGKSKFFVVINGETPEELKKENGGVYNSVESEEVDGSLYFFCATIDDDKKVEISANEEDAAFTIAIAKNLKSERARSLEQQRILRQFQNNAAVAPSRAPKKESEIIIVEDLADLMAAETKAGKIHFFTGAGLSYSSVPDWNSLMKLMGFNLENPYQESIRTTAENISKDNAQSLMEEIHKTHRSFFSGVPSVGHKAIGEISKATNCAIFTDNRDILHQVSGDDAIHVCQISNFYERPWKPEAECDPSQIKMIIVCGMGGDRRGFLRKLKEQNPDVKIANINLNNGLNVASHVMAPVDYFIEGDAQEILPRLKELFFERLKPNPNPQNSENSENSQQLQNTDREINA